MVDRLSLSRRLLVKLPAFESTIPAASDLGTTLSSEHCTFGSRSPCSIRGIEARIFGARACLLSTEMNYFSRHGCPTGDSGADPHVGVASSTVEWLAANNDERVSQIRNALCTSAARLDAFLTKLRHSEA